MLDKIIQWTSRVMDWGIHFQGAAQEEARGTETERSTFESQGWILDPRELPRPHRVHDLRENDHSDMRKNENRNKSQTGTWCCRNCSHLSAQLLECAICLEPLVARTRKGITSCIDCGNVACLICAERLTRCPYCRSEPGLASNMALQRLVYKLDIPQHKKSNLPVRCPHKKCGWRGGMESLAKHLEQAHLVTILNGSRVTLHIADFHRKAEMSVIRSRHYSVLLSCFNDVFVCKVILFHGKLKVLLSQVTKVKHTRIAAWIEISCLSKMTMGIIPLSKNKSEFEVPVTNFVFPTKGSNDRVTISISIRPLC